MLLELQGLKAGIEDKSILKGVDLTIQPGEVHVVMGPNGSGKSTLANVIMNTGGYEITEGEIRLKGENINDDGADKRARKGLFMSYQSPVAIPGVTVENFLRAAIGAKNGELPGFFDLREEMDELMDELHIDPEYKERYVNQGFSGGERKKMEILQLLMLDPDLAILDETDSGLDVDAIDLVGRGIAKFMKKEGKSLLVITHHHEILKYVEPDVVHVMVDGKIVKTDGPALMDKIDREGFGFIRGQA